MIKSPSSLSGNCCSWSFQKYSPEYKKTIVCKAKTRLTDKQSGFDTSLVLKTNKSKLMLGKEQKQVTWKQDIGKINANDQKARVRHLETVKARIMAMRARTTRSLGRE
jgi:hypothetical protein